MTRKFISLDELFEEALEARKAELAEQDAFDKTPEGQARIAKREAVKKAEFEAGVRLGWWDENGESLQPETDDEEDDEEEEEE